MQQVAENYSRIWEAGAELFERVCKFAEHLDRLQDGLVRAMQSCNAALGSWESRVIPNARKLKEIGASAPERELPGIEPLDTVLRELTESKGS